MEHKFDIKELEYKPVARKQDSTIIKICKKKKVVDEVFPEEGVENIYDPGPLIIDKLLIMREKVWQLCALHYNIWRLSTILSVVLKGVCHGIHDLY